MGNAKLRSMVLAMAVGLAGMLAGCNAPAVSREAEAARFQEELKRRAAELAIDPTKPLTMEQCEQLALSNSLDLRVRQLALRMQDEQIRLALSQGLPKANLGWNETWRSNDPAVQLGGQTASFEDRHQQGLAIRAVQPVLDFGLTYYSYQIAVDQKEQQELLIARAEQTLRRDVRTAYAQAAGAIRQERYARIAVKAAHEVLRVQKNLEKEQLAVPADTSLIEAAVAQAELNLSLSSQSVAQTQLILTQLMSLPPGTRFVVIADQPNLPAPPTGEMVSAFESFALQRRPELHVQDLSRHIAANSIRREASAFFPKLDASAAFNWSNNAFVVNPSFFVLGYTISHSLLDGGATIFRYNLAKKASTVEETRTLLLSLGVMYEVDLLALRVQQAQETVVAARVLEDARTRALERTISLFRAGQVDQAAAARSVADLTQQATTLDQAQTAYQVAWYELEAAALPSAMPTTRAATQPAPRTAASSLPTHFELFPAPTTRPATTQP